MLLYGTGVSGDSARSVCLLLVIIVLEMEVRASSTLLVLYNTQLTISSHQRQQHCGQCVSPLIQPRHLHRPRLHPCCRFLWGSRLYSSLSSSR